MTDPTMNDCITAEADALRAENERLRAALGDAGDCLNWAARRMQDACCSRADYMAAHLAASDAFMASRKSLAEAP